MGYSSNKRFSPLTDSIGVVIDGCGDTYENKYYVNGMYIDLCGMSIEDYMTNPCCGGADKPGTTTKPVNEIFVKSIEGENGVIYYQAYAKYAVTSNVKIMVASINGNVTELDIYVGEMQSVPEIGESMEFTNVSLSVSEDEAFKYDTVIEDVVVEYNIYYKAVHLNESGILTNDYNSIPMRMETTTDLKFVIEPTDVDYNAMEDIEEFERFCLENQYCLSLYLPRSVYDDKAYIISNYSGGDITGNFVFEKFVTIDGTEYAFLNEKANGDIMPYIPLYQQELIYEYKLSLNK